MSGNADFSKLSMDDEKNHVISLTNFNDFQDRNIFNKRFRPHPSSQVLNQDFALFDEIFLGSKTEPKSIVVDGYRAKDLIFEHPRQIYKEFQAISEISKQDEALLRLWDFNKLHGTKANTLNGRFEIISREREVLQFIKHKDHDLYKNCLRSLTSVQKDDVTTEYREVYELPPGHIRLNEFIGKYCQSIPENDRINIVKLLIAKFATLHSMKIAHRDIGDHSLWLSPSKEIALSNFISAYHQPSGTVGDYRKELSVDSIVGFDLISTKNNMTPFEQDVQSLGVIGWHILTAQRLSKKSIASIQQQLNESSAWYAHIFMNSIKGSDIKNAINFFEQIKKLEPKDISILDFDNSSLEPYRKPISHTRQYREDSDFLFESEEKEIYISDGCLVKAWLNINSPSDSTALSYKILHFLEKIEKIYSISPPYLPKIRDFGIAVKSSSLYLVTDFVKGQHWDEVELSKDQKLTAINQLIMSIEHLHSLGVSHGDLHPKNLFVSDFGKSITLIDIPDFNNSEEDSKNHRYSPENIDNCTAFERDNFAVMRMSCELLGMEWGSDSIDYPQISSVALLELKDMLFGFKSLSRFHKAINSLSIEVDERLISITVRGNFVPLIIYPDNGHLYVKIEKSHKDDSNARVRFIGIGGSFDAIYKTQEKSFTLGFPPKLWNSIKKEDADDSQIDLQFPIKVMPGENNDLNAMTQRLSNNEEFSLAVSLLFKDDNKNDGNDGLTEQLREAFQKIDELEIIDGFEVPEISTSKLWKAILKTETESYPYIEVYADPVPAKESSGELIIPYKSDVDVLGGFNKVDEIEAILVDDDKEIALGNVLLKKSLINEVRLEKVRGRAYKLKEGDLVFFRTKQDRASYIKRKVALERLLDRESVIPDIPSAIEFSASIFLITN
jgi:serine/threonine protein kinase